MRLEPWELQRWRWLGDGGLCYFVRHNQDGELERADREVDGIQVSAKPFDIQNWVEHTFGNHHAKTFFEMGLTMVPIPSGWRRT